MRTLHAMFTVLLLASISWAKTPLSDWGGVEDIPTGWRIAVVTEFTFPCIFVQASADELVCRILGVAGMSAICRKRMCVAIAFAKCESTGATAQMP